MYQGLCSAKTLAILPRFTGNYHKLILIGNLILTGDSPIFAAAPHVAGENWDNPHHLRPPCVSCPAGFA